MKKVKIILCVLLVLAVIASPFAFVCAYAISLPKAYSETFYGALNEKYDRLTELDEEKIVVVGGSSVAFGLDSELLERYMGMPVVNFGLYADLGTKMMLDLSLAGIGEGDIVVLAPEMDAQTLSLYFNNQSALMALDDDFSMIRHLKPDDVLSCIGGSWRFARDKRDRLENSVALDAIYRSEYFNEYGDFVLTREENVMRSYYDSNNEIVLDQSKYGKELDEFIDYVNQYVKKCERRGATVYFSFCPMNSLALSDTSDLLRRAELPFVDVLYDGEDDPVCVYYELSLLSDGSYGVSGLTELGKQESTLTLPLGYNGRKVTAVLENAFIGTTAERIVIGKDSNIVIIHNGAFVGASSVKDLSIYKINAADIMPPVDFYGVHPDFAVHVPVGSSYGDNYDWSNKAEYVYDLT